MKKKLLVVLLAFTLVLAFSATALAATSVSAADFRVTAAADTNNHVASIVAGDNNAYTVYTDDTSVTLTFSNIADGVTLSGAGLSDDKVTITNDVTITATIPAAEEGEEDTVKNYTFTLQKVTITIDSKLYSRTVSGDTVTYTELAKKDGAYYVDAGETPYIKISVPNDVSYTLSGDGVSSSSQADDSGYVKLNIDDQDATATVRVLIGGVEFDSQDFNLLRPTLDEIHFNSKASNNGDETLNIVSGQYGGYNTMDQVDGDWTTAYFQIVPVSNEAEITVTRYNSSSSSSGTKLNPATNGWYSQTMSRVYYLKITVEVGELSQDYYLYLMGDDYTGPEVKAFAASSKTKGAGDEYLTVVDTEKNNLYLFLPDGVTSSDTVYFRVDTTADVSSLRLDGEKISEGSWDSMKASDISGAKLTYEDDYGISYSYTVHVYYGKSSYTDATLKNLVVKSGTKSNTAGTVDINFSRTTYDYAFAVDSGDKWLSITPTRNESNATIFINNQLVTSGKAYQVTDLDPSKVTEYQILVVAGDCETTKTYTLTVNGSIGLLQSLSASNLNGLTPYFSPDINTYTGYTAAGTTSTYIYALAKNYTSDFVQISKANFNAYGQASSYTALTAATKGGASVTAELKSGANIFRVDVLASATATSAKASYYLNVYVPTASPRCVVSSQTLYVNGVAKTLSAYNIAGNNYLKLRDIAALLDGTTKEMNVGWNQNSWTATLTMPGTFAKRGDELTTLTAPKSYALSTQYFTLNGSPVFPLAYNVTGTGDSTGSNYVMLRDLASLLDFGVTYNANTQAINISTSSGYTPGL